VPFVGNVADFVPPFPMEKSMFKSLGRSASRIAFVVCLNWMFAATLQAQTVSVVQISGTGVYERSPNHDGLTFVGSINSDAEFLVVVDGEYPSSTYVTIGAESVTVVPAVVGDFSLANPVVKSRDDEYSFSFAAVPTELKGTELESPAANAWMTSNSSWYAGRFGWGWQESLGEFLAVNVLIPILGVENLANASDTTLVTDTVIASIPIAVGIVAGGEVVLGVGTLGGAATTGTAATGAGALTTVSTTAGTVHVSTVGTVATVEVGFIESVTLPLVRTVTQTAINQGATTVIVNTGPVVNVDLAIKLGLAAQNGTSVLGGTVTLIEGGVAPIFEILIAL
jgi:hypothetical protein